MKLSTSDGRAFPETAEAWMARLIAADCSEEDRAAFEFWRAVDPAHADAFAEIEHLHRSTALLADDPLIRAVSRAARRQTAATGHRWFGWALAAAAAIVLAVGLTLRPYGTASSERRYTSTTTLQTVHLADGTRMRLDAASSATVRFDRHHRVVQLDSGRAEFAVAADTDRPFEVHAGDAIIRDIGTTFQVSHNEQRVSIGLLEGRVEISGRRAGQIWVRQLMPSQQLQIDADGQAEPIAPLDIAAAQGWPLGQLVFHQRRLDDLLSEVNRYSSLKMRLGDPSLASLRVSGSFHAGDQQILAKALERGWQMKITRTTPEEITLQRGTGSSLH
jgi:transmembrane sensor